jgi:hypothetical protein
MSEHNRREFLADVGRGMLAASVGSAMAADLGLTGAALAADGPEALSFGKREPLVRLMQETPVARLLPALTKELKDGTELRDLVAAAALANARMFGGEDYVGFHTFMALTPAYQMAQELPKERQALPIFKVLYRNTAQIHARGGRKREVLHPVKPAELPSDVARGELLRKATHSADVTEAERTFAALAAGKPEDVYNDLHFAIEDHAEVHRVVLTWRAWDVLSLTGKEQAHTMLRQSVRYCVRTEQHYKRARRAPPLRDILPKLLDGHKLVGKTPGKRKAEDGWILEMIETVLASSGEKAADAVAAALADGIDPEGVGEMLALAANQQVLRAPGRTAADGSAKPVGSVHGDSVGVHCSDAVNAWRHIARVSNPRNAYASLIVAAYYAAGRLGGARTRKPWPWAEHVEKVTATDAKTLLAQAEEAIKGKDQARACAVVQRCGELGLAARPVFDLLLKYAISEDGALHAEKFYRTASEEFAAIRPAFRWRQLVALARVTASAYGLPAPGYAEACGLLHV